MGRTSKGPWPRKTGGWWVWHEGSQVRLGETKAAAWRAWHLLQAGEPITDGTILFREVADQYTLHLRRMRSARHAKDSLERLDAFVQPWWNRSAKGLRWPDVENVLETKAWNSTTQGNHLTALRACLRWAEKTRLIESNPIPHISIPRAQVRENAMTKAQVASLLKHAGDAVQPILWALSVTGARPGELIGATIDQCDEDGTAIRLPKSKVGRRIIWFPPKDRKRMATLRKSRIAGPLFPAEGGKKWSKRFFCEAAKEAREAAGLPDWATPYTLRHAWITERLREGMSKDDVAELVGTSVAMIERTYRHLIDGDLKKIADRL